MMNLIINLVVSAVILLGALLMLRSISKHGRERIEPPLSPCGHRHAGYCDDGCGH
jgi:hypothetical protein